MPSLKSIGIGTAGLVALLAVTVAAVVATFDPNRFKPQIVAWVKDSYGRTLAIDGPIQLKFLPRIAAAASGVTLSGHDSPEPFARVAEARVSLALLPLLARKVIVDRVEIDGLDVDLVRYKDGRTNFDDLLGKATPMTPTDRPATGGPPLVLDVSAIQLRNGAFRYRDEAAGWAIQWSDVDMVTGRIAYGVPGKVVLTGRANGDSPSLDANVKLAGRYRLEVDGPGVQFEGLDVQVQGNVAGMSGLKAALNADVAWAGGSRIEVRKLAVSATSLDGLDARLGTARLAFAPGQWETAPLEASLKWVQAGRRMGAQMTLAALKAAGPRIDSANLDATFDMRDDKLAVESRFASPLRLDLDAAEVGLTRLAGSVAVTGPGIPNQSMRFAVGGTAQIGWARRNVRAELTAGFDESNARLRLDVTDFARPVPVFDLDVDRFDLDRYLGRATAAGTSGKGAQGAPPREEEPIDLSALKALNATGRLHVGALVAARIRAQNLDVKMKAAHGVLVLDPASARLYQGSASGAATIDSNGNRFALRQQLANVAVGSLLLDATGKDILEGRGTVAIDVTTTGKSVSALKRALNGKAGLNLRDGAIKGVDLGAIARRVRSLGAGKLETAVSTATEKTDFTELSATFVVRNGVAHNDDLVAKSPFIRVNGAGDVDVGRGSVDYLLKATVVATAAGQGGRALADLRGLTIPVRLTGSFDEVKYSVDAGALAAEAAKGEITRRLEDKVPKAPLEEALKSLLGR